MNVLFTGLHKYYQALLDLEHEYGKGRIGRLRDWGGGGGGGGTKPRFYNTTNIHFRAITTTSTTKTASLEAFPLASFFPWVSSLNEEQRIH